MEKTELLACPLDGLQAKVYDYDRSIFPEDEAPEYIVRDVASIEFPCRTHGETIIWMHNGLQSRSFELIMPEYASPDNPPLTLEELREFKEAASYREFMPMEVNEDGERFCPRCHQEIVGYYTEYCEHCGQAVESPSEKVV